MWSDHVPRPGPGAREPGPGPTVKVRMRMRNEHEHCFYATWQMAKSIRSKRRQKVLAVRREKYREREKKKLWEKHLTIQAQRTVEMEGEGEPSGGNANW